MKSIECLLVYANESREKLGIIDLYKALSTVRDFPWNEENKKTEQNNGCYASVCFSTMPISSKSNYLNISKIDGSLYDIQIEYFRDSLIMGLIPWRTSTYLIQDGLSAVKTEEFITRFFKLSDERLFDWVKLQKSRM